MTRRDALIDVIESLHAEIAALKSNDVATLERATAAKLRAIEAVRAFGDGPAGPDLRSLAEYLAERGGWQVPGRSAALHPDTPSSPPPACDGSSPPRERIAMPCLATAGRHPSIMPAPGRDATTYASNADVGRRRRAADGMLAFPTQP